MANWFQNIIGRSKHRRSRELEVPEPEFRLAKLPPRKGDAEATRNESSEIKDEPSKIIETAFELQRFEVQVSPHEFRFALARNADGLIAYKLDPNSPCQTFVLQIKSIGNIEPAFASLHFLLEKHKIFDVPVHDLEKAFQTDSINIPSMHLRFGYLRRQWSSFYLMSEVPPEIGAFYGDCYQLAIQITSGPKRAISSRHEGRIRSRY